MVAKVYQIFAGLSLVFTHLLGAFNLGDREANKE